MARRARDWFHKMAPAGYRIRVMEPGEAPALLSIRAAATAGSGAGPRSIDPFVAWLLRHEVFVAATRAGAPVGFAAAAGEGPRYWLTGLFVQPDQQGRGIGTALVEVVATRAGWFGHDQLALSAGPGTAGFFERCDFRALPRQDGPGLHGAGGTGEPLSSAMATEPLVWMRPL